MLVRSIPITFPRPVSSSLFIAVFLKFMHCLAGLYL